jgi:cysteine desulfurase
MLANNEIGVLQDIPSLSAIAEAAGAITHCDATQAVGKIPVDVTVLNVDLLSCTAHKMYGPKGVGALYIRSGRRHPRIKPLVHGGGHEKGLRSGTLNVAGIVGFGVACRIARQQLEQEAIRINSLSTRLLATLQEELGEVDLNGSAQHRIPGNLNLHIKGVDSTRLLGLTNTKVAYSTSAACQSNSHVPSHVLQAIGLSEAEQRRSIRIGIGRFTSQEEVDLAGEILCRAVKELRDQAQHK